MTTAMVLVCALQVLGRSAASLPPIELVTRPLPGVAPNVEGFVRGGSGVISVLTTSDVFAAARLGDCASDAVTKLASIVAHEEWHVLHGGDERGAYEWQLQTLVRLGVSATGSLFQGVIRAMRVVLASQTPAGRLLR